MYKYKNTLLHGLLFASLVAFPVASATSSLTDDSNNGVNTQTEHLNNPNLNDKGTGDVKKDVKGNNDTQMSTSGVTLGWFYYGRPHWYRPYRYFYPYRPYYYNYYRPYYYNYNYWPYHPYRYGW